MSLSLENAIVEVQNLCSSTHTVQELTEIEQKAKDIYDQHQSSEELAIKYICFLLKLSWEQGDFSVPRSAIREAKRVYKQHCTSNDLATHYFSFLSNLCWKQEEKKVLNYAAKEAERVYNQHQSSNNIAMDYLRFLNLLCWKNEEKHELENFEKEAARVYSQDSSIIDRAVVYISILGNLLMTQKEKDDRKETVDKAKKVFNLHKSSENVAREYFDFLLKACWGQEEDKVIEIFEDARRDYSEDSSSVFVAKCFLNFLWQIIHLSTEVSGITKITEEIFSILQKYPHLIGMVEKYIDRLMSFGTVENNYIDKTLERLNFFAEREEGENYLKQSKYSVIFETYGHISDDEMRRLIEIFSLVQKIKENLIVKNPDKMKFGHYTSGRVLQIHLKQRKNEKHRYGIESRSRLGNVNYMNDPSEGKLLDRILQLDKNNHKKSLKASPWFLMSLTTAIDKLEMWAQYGEQAKGVCLILNPRDFYKDEILFSPKWFKEKSVREASEDEDNDYDSEGVSRLFKNLHGDYIYRIGYLATQVGESGLLTVENNNCLEEKEIETINESLNSLKEKVQGLEVDSVLYEKVDECLEEIRYLFKSADYSYESELRVLKYMPLEPDNPKIKIDDSGEFAKLYIERDNPIQIAEVIFGPKFQNPENVTPLLQLLDKNIKFSQSKISFK